MGFNKQLGQLINEASCSLFVGDRGSGKSSLMALAVKYGMLSGRKVYCQYPYRGAYSIPLVDKKVGGLLTSVVDKDWLYESDLSDSLVMIDEARTVWNARDFKNWNENDEQFFNFIRKFNTSLILATQRYDALDLNIRVASDYTFFIQRSRFFKNISTVDVSRTCQVKIADRNTQIVSRGYSKNAMRVVWDIAEMPIAYCHFYRRPYYGCFETNYVTCQKLPAESVKWDDIVNF